MTRLSPACLYGLQYPARNPAPVFHTDDAARLREAAARNRKWLAENPDADPITRRSMEEAAAWYERKANELSTEQPEANRAEPVCCCYEVPGDNPDCQQHIYFPVEVQG